MKTTPAQSGIICAGKFNLSRHRLVAIIGGAGTFTGPVIGAASLHLLDTVLREQTIPLGGQ